MILYFVGIGCVGKSTIGKMVAEKIGYSYFDLDIEIERYYDNSIERMQTECIYIDAFRKKASVVLNMLFSKNINAVVSGTPAGLLSAYLEVYMKHKAEKPLYSIFLNDTPKNILERIAFYDIDSKPIIKTLSNYKKTLYLREIRADYNHFKDSYKLADLEVNIENINLVDIPNLIIDMIDKKLKIKL